MKNLYDITAAQYGSHLFTEMLTVKESKDEYWDGIRAEAEPLVRKLIALNDKVTGDRYNITNYIKEDGTFVLSEKEQIEANIYKALAVWAKDVVECSYIWIPDYQNMLRDDPYLVVDKTSKGIYVNYGQQYRLIENNEKVLLAPSDYKENQAKYESKEYWLNLS